MVNLTCMTTARTMVMFMTAYVIGLPSLFKDQGCMALLVQSRATGLSVSAGSWIAGSNQHGRWRYSAGTLDSSVEITTTNDGYDGNFNQIYNRPTATTTCRKYGRVGRQRYFWYIARACNKLVHSVNLK